MDNRTSNQWRKYQRVGAIEARPYEHDDQAKYVISISEADLKLPTLIGGMIARNPDNPTDQWYIAQDFFLKHYGPKSPDETTSREWQPIETAPHGIKLIVGYPNRLGNWRTVLACYYEAGTLESYNDSTEDGFARPDWYEESETHEELMPCDEAPTHWMPLPAKPAAPTTASPQS